MSTNTDNANKSCIFFNLVNYVEHTRKYANIFNGGFCECIKMKYNRDHTDCCLVLTGLLFVKMFQPCCFAHMYFFWS